MNNSKIMVTNTIIASTAQEKVQLQWEEANVPLYELRAIHYPEFNARKRYSIHTRRLEYISGKWYLSDGTGLKGSTNGTWIFMEDPMKVIDGMVFKAGQLLFKAKVVGKPKEAA